MKSKLLILVSVLLFSTFCYSQEVESREKVITGKVVIPLDFKKKQKEIRHIFLPAGVIADASKVDEAVEDLVIDSNKIYVVLADGPLEGVASGDRSYMQMYYPFYKIKVNLATKKQNRYDYVYDHELTKTVSSVSNAYVYRIESGQQVQELRIISQYHVKLYFLGGYTREFDARIIVNNDEHPTATSYSFLGEVDNPQNEQLDFDYQ